LRRETRIFLGYFVWKITILCQKIIFLGEARTGCASYNNTIIEIYWYKTVKTR
jgi:hypothetical protein